MVEEITRLKVENQRLRQVFFLCICALFAVVFFGATRQSKEVVAEKFVLVDDKGNIKAELTSGPEGPRFTFFGNFLGENGKAYVNFNVRKEEAAITFLDAKGRPRITTNLTEEGQGVWFFNSKGIPQMCIVSAEETSEITSLIALCGPEGKLRMAMSSGKDKWSINFYDYDYDPKGKTRLSIGLQKEGPGIVLFGPEGNLRLNIGLSETGSNITFLDSEEKKRLAIALPERALSKSLDLDMDVGPTISLSDSEGNLRLTIGLVDESPGIDFYNSKGKLIRQLP